MEGVREHRVRGAKMLMKVPEFCSGITAIRDKLKVPPRELRNAVRVFVRLDGGPAYSVLESHLREINPDIAPRWFREEIRGLLQRFSLHSWWWEEWLVRHVLFDEFDEQRIPDQGYRLAQRRGLTGQEELYIRVDLEIPGADQALRELSPYINAYHRWVAGPRRHRLRSTPKFERHLDWWGRVRIFGQSPEEISAEWQDETKEQWESEIETLMKEQGMKQVEAEDYLLAQWEKAGRLEEAPDPDSIRRAVQRLDERYRDLFGIDPRDLGHAMSDT